MHAPDHGNGQFAENKLRRLQIKDSVADETSREAVWELQDCEDAIDNTTKQVQDSVTSDDPATDIFYSVCADILANSRKHTAALDPESQSRRKTQCNLCSTSSSDKNNNDDDDETISCK